jgi:acetyltransferase-like isoleucine patch superfamily enzyme
MSKSDRILGFVDGSSFLGEDVSIGPDTVVKHSFIGDYTYTGRRCRIENARVGKFCSLANNISINVPNHNYRLVSTHPFHYHSYYGHFIEEYETKDLLVYSDCVVGNDVWLSENCHVLGDVVVGDGAVVGSGAVVTKDVPPYAIVAGVPAKVIKYRFDKKTIAKLLEIKWWNLPKDEIKSSIARGLFLSVSDFTEYFNKP